MDVIVANRTIAEPLLHTSRRIVMFGRTPGQTNARFMDHAGNEMLSLNIRVERDITGLKALLAEHGGSDEVQVKAVNNNLLLTGRVPNAVSSARIERLASLWLDEATTGGVEGGVVNLMNITARDQVMLKVRIVEMQRSVTKQLGINLAVAGQIGDATVSLMSNNGLATGAGFDGAFQWNNSGGGSLQQLTTGLQALERVGLVRTVAEPTLTTVSGESASFQSGGEFPILSNVIRDDTGQLTRAFEFKEFGVSVGFTPVVLDEGRISLNLETGITEPTTDGSFETGGIGGDVLGLRTRRAASVVEVPAGSSIVIAGLIREESRSSADGTPGVKDIPGLGALFRNRDEVNTQTELVIIATPYLVDGTHPDNLQTPADGFVPASDAEQIFLGRLNKANKRGKNSKDLTPTRPGTFGYMVD